MKRLLILLIIILSMAQICSAVPVLQDHYNESDGMSPDIRAGIQDYHWEAQIFTPSQDYIIQSVKFLISADSDASANTITASIRDMAFDLSGPDLCSGTLSGASIGVGPYNYAWHEIDFGAGTSLTGGNDYGIVLRSDEISANIRVWVDFSSPTYTGGSRVNSNDYGANWFAPLSGHDFAFETYSVPEPATVCLFGLGMLGILRKRRKV